MTMRLKPSDPVTGFLIDRVQLVAKAVGLDPATTPCHAQIGYRQSQAAYLIGQIEDRLDMRRFAGASLYTRLRMIDTVLKYKFIEKAVEA